MNYFFMALLLVFLSCDSDDAPPDGYEPPAPITRRDCYSTWSGARDLIAYFHYDELPSYDPDSTGIYTIRPDGSDVTFFYCWPEILGLEWSPDGNWLAVNTHGGLFKISYPDSQKVQLQGPGDYYEPAWSPDGSKISCSWRMGEPMGLYILNSDGSDYHRLFQGDYASWDTNDSLFFSNGSSPLPIGAICKADTSEIIKRLCVDNGQYDSIFMIIDIASNAPKDRLVFQINNNYPHMSLWVWEPNQVGKRRLATGAENPCFSPDGQMIVYSNINFGYGNLWIVNWNGTGRRQLTL